MNEMKPRTPRTRTRIRIGLVIVILGLLALILGTAPGIFGLDRSQVTGFVQIAVFLIGLAMICIGGYLSLNALWNGHPKTISADIGYRLVATGYVISVASGMADVFGFGSQVFPNIPYFGPLQAIGVMIGEVIIALGFVLLIPLPGTRPKSEDRRPQISDRSQS
jgi:hypothetical protein